MVMMIITEKMMMMKMMMKMMKKNNLKNLRKRPTKNLPIPLNLLKEKPVKMEKNLNANNNEEP